MYSSAIVLLLFSTIYIPEMLFVKIKFLNKPWAYLKLFMSKMVVRRYLY